SLDGLWPVPNRHRKRGNPKGLSVQRKTDRPAQQRRVTWPGLELSGRHPQRPPPQVGVDVQRQEQIACLGPPPLYGPIGKSGGDQPPVAGDVDRLGCIRQDLLPELFPVFVIADEIVAVAEKDRRAIGRESKVRGGVLCDGKPSHQWSCSRRRRS